MKNLFFVGLAFLILSCQAEQVTPVSDQAKSNEATETPCAETAKKLEQEIASSSTTKAFDLTGESNDAGCTITKDSL